MESEPPLAVSECPETLREREQWVCWREEERDDKLTKIPVTPATGGFASSTDPETWDSLETALEYTETEHADGVGFVFTDDDPIVGVDLDDCRDPETDNADDVALDIIERLDSYTEVSPSGTGYHVLITGELPEGRNRRGASSCTTRHVFLPSLATTSSEHPRALHADRTRSTRFTASTSRHRT
jgi:primase-polymerase (primpol)-like protein